VKEYIEKGRTPGLNKNRRAEKNNWWSMEWNESRGRDCCIM